MEDHAVAEQLARGPWRSMIPTENPEWVLRVAELESTDQPLGDYGELVRRMLRAGITPGEIARFARIIGYEVAQGVAHYLGDPLAAASDDDPMEGLCWISTESIRPRINRSRPSRGYTRSFSSSTRRVARCGRRLAEPPAFRPGWRDPRHHRGHPPRGSALGS